MKTICIDARFWGVKNTGIGRYIENLIDNLPPNPGVRIVLIVPPALAIEPKIKNFKKYYAKFHPYSYIAQFEMLLLLYKINPDLLHVPHFTIPIFWPGKIVITLHDLIKHYSIGSGTTTRFAFIYWIKYLQYIFIVWLAVRRSKHIIVPAKYWKDIIVKKYNLNPDKVSVTYEGVSSSFVSLQSTTYNLQPKIPYILYVGNLYPHKNIPVLLQAVKILEGGIKLKIVCARDVFRTRIEKVMDNLKISDKVNFLGFVTDMELANTYSKAVAFVTPSLLEGFGLPGLEAMAVGCPVIAARSSCLPEVYKDAALFFDPSDPNDLVKCINNLIDDKNLREDLIKKGIILAKTYSWQKMSAQTWQIYLNELK